MSGKIKLNLFGNKGKSEETIDTFDASELEARNDMLESEEDEIAFGRKRNVFLPPLDLINTDGNYSNIEDYTINAVDKPIITGQKISISKPSTSQSRTKTMPIIPTRKAKTRTEIKEREAKEFKRGQRPVDFLSMYKKNLRQLPIVLPKGLIISAWSHEELEKISVVKINNSSSSYGNFTVNDKRLGVIDNKDKCGTCGLSQDCPGHYGMINIEKAMVLNPLFIEITCMVLGSVCNSCGTIKISKENIRLHGINAKTGYKRLRAIYDITKDSQTCTHSFDDVSLEEDDDVNNILSPESRAILAESEDAANNAQCKLNPIISIAESKSSGRIQYKIEKKGKGMSMTNEDVFSILSSISRSDSKLLGFIDIMHPRDLIIRSLPVIPVKARPPGFSSKGQNDNFITSQYIKIIKAYNTIIQEPKLKSKHDGDRDK